MQMVWVLKSSGSNSRGLEWSHSTINVIEVDHMEAVGVKATELSADVRVGVTDEGVDIQGHTTLSKAVVGDGTLELRELSGQFQMVQDDEVFFETQDMTVGQVTLIPAQYVVDGGGLQLRLDGDNLLAELHLLRNRKTFMKRWHMQYNRWDLASR